MQRIPIDCYLSAADAEKAAEIDDGGAQVSHSIDNDIDDATHVLIGGAADLPAEHALRLLAIKCHRCRPVGGIFSRLAGHPVLGA